MVVRFTLPLCRSHFECRGISCEAGPCIAPAERCRRRCRCRIKIRTTHSRFLLARETQPSAASQPVRLTQALIADPKSTISALLLISRRQQWARVRGACLKWWRDDCRRRRRRRNMGQSLSRNAHCDSRTFSRFGSPHSIRSKGTGDAIFCLVARLVGFMRDSCGLRRLRGLKDLHCQSSSFAQTRQELCVAQSS